MVQSRRWGPYIRFTGGIGSPHPYFFFTFSTQKAVWFCPPPPIYYAALKVFGQTLYKLKNFV